MLDCTLVQNLILSFTRFCSSKNVNVILTKETLLFGILLEKCEALNTIIICIKLYIYRNKCLKNRITFAGLAVDLKNLYIITKHIATKSNEIERFEKIWGKWSFLNQ